jgi:predicted aspartyl protease
MAKMILCGFDDSPNGKGSEFLVSLGPTVLVDIGFDSTFRHPQIPPPTPGMRGLQALIDTGASECCIDSLLASQLGLPIVDRRPISGVHGSKDANMHLAQIYVPSIPFVMYGRFAAVDLIAGGQVHHALLGRTFLNAFHLFYDGLSGTVSLTLP